MGNLLIGTCSFKYPSWKGLVYSAARDINFLGEYARRFNCVEIDRWFWSLFYPRNTVLPDPSVVREYDDSTPDDFRFSIKAPNSLSLTHYYQRDTGGRLEPNPHFLSVPLYDEFLELLKPLEHKIDSIIFQFEYLNRQKMGGLDDFLQRLDTFFTSTPRTLPTAIEVRNKFYLSPRYFDFLRERQLSHVFVHGYWMPPVTEVYDRFGDRIGKKAIIRLMGQDRTGMEKKTGKKWDRIVLEKDTELHAIAGTIRSMLERNMFVTVSVNNHYQGSAPLTIAKLKTELGTV